MIRSNLEGNITELNEGVCFFLNLFLNCILQMLVKNSDFSFSLENLVFKYFLVPCLPNQLCRTFSRVLPLLFPSLKILQCVPADNFPLVNYFCPGHKVRFGFVSVHH